jgi:Flp pilus assembly protein TadD
VLVLMVRSGLSVAPMANDLVKLQRSARDVARWQKAQQQVVAERYGSALPIYRDLVQRFPGVEQLWFELGLAALGESEFEQAVDAFTRAARLAPNDSALQVLLGQQFHRLRRSGLARACFEQAVVADPRSTHAQLSLAAWWEREHKLDRAMEAAEACLTRHPRHLQAQCVKALLLHRQNRNTEAETVLRDVIGQDSSDPNVRISARHLLGVVLDRLGHYDDALRWLIESKNLLRQTANVTKMEQDYDRADRFRRELLGAITTETVRRWREQLDPNSVQRLALLGGHPRSGTTLLEQILGAHPSIVAIDESEAFVQEIWHRLAPMQATEALTLEHLERVDTVQRGRMRERYIKSVSRELEHGIDGRLLLDKNPSPTAALHLWLKVLPETKVIIALRDPRDVVVSCFFQNLMLTPTNVNFLTLERTVKHYGDLMDVWLRMRELGGFDWIESRYEDLVENPAVEGKRVTEFCGLAWQPEQENHEAAARGKVLFAPTFSDVTQPVHKRALGRWHHYARALEPHQETLARFCSRMGYSV